MIKVPFSILPPPVLYQLGSLFRGFAELIRPFFPFLPLHLRQAEFKVSAREYLALCMAATVSFFIIGTTFFLLLLFLFRSDKYIIAPAVLFFIGIFTFLQQVMYPRLMAARRIKGVEKNLLSALRTILIQINSGIPLFEVLVSISAEDYGESSYEFRKAAKEINAGRPEVEALEELATENPSLYFRRAIWQIANGMKAGSDISSVLKEVISALSQEQLIQIENYGSQLNPLAMFYMLVAIILPALGMAFLIVISSFVNLAGPALQMVFWALLAFVIFFQFMFLGMIRTRRPNLLGT